MFDVTLMALMALGGAQQSDEVWTSRPDLLRGVQAIAYWAPAICPGEDQIALQLFNVSEFHTLTPDLDIAMVEYSIIGRQEDGSYVSLPEDRGLVFQHELSVGTDTISCIRSEAMAQGMRSFVIALEEYGLPAGK